MEAAIAGQESESSASDLLRLTRLARAASGKAPVHDMLRLYSDAVGQAEPRVSTGLDALDEVLGGLYWGDNVVWRLDRAPLEPFYRAIASTSGTFETRAAVSVGNAVNTYGVPGLAIMDAGWARRLLHEIRRICRPKGRRLFLFESLDSMVRSWGAAGTREFFARCCPLLLDAGAISYWTMSARDTPACCRETVHAVAHCMLHVDERSVRVVRRRAATARSGLGPPLA